MKISSPVRILAAFVFAFGLVASAEARLVDITLEQLVRKSTLIAYGRSIKHATGSSSSVVLFEPIQILKGDSHSHQAPLPLCNAPADVETYDLAALAEPYIVFASYAKGCYRPVHGLRSVIKVENQTAQTISISNQSESQPIDEFLAQIKAAQKRKKAAR